MNHLGNTRPNTRPSDRPDARPSNRRSGVIKLPKNVPGWVSGEIKNKADIKYDIDGGKGTDGKGTDGDGSDGDGSDGKDTDGEEVECNIKPQIAWNRVDGGLTLTYTVEKKEVEQDAKVAVYWASDATFSSRIGNAFFEVDVPQGTKVGLSAAIPIKGDFLKDAPEGTRNLIVVCNQGDNLASLADAVIHFGAQANASVVSLQTQDVLKDLLRLSGRPSLTINSTARTPNDQARAMFNNLVHAGDTPQMISQRIAAQYTIYAPPGDAVIGVFESNSVGKTAAEILGNSGAIKDAMEAEILSQGPENVSKHCADSTILNVVDIGNNVGTLFRDQAQAESRVSKILDENGVYHLEIPQDPQE